MIILFIPISVSVSTSVRAGYRNKSPLSEITHPNDDDSIASKTFSTPEHDQKFLPQIKDHASELVKLAQPNNDNVANLHDEMNRVR